MELTGERAGGHVVEAVTLGDVDGLQERVVPERAFLNDEAVCPDIAPLYRELPEVRESFHGVCLEIGELV